MPSPGQGTKVAIEFFYQSYARKPMTLKPNVFHPRLLRDVDAAAHSVQLRKASSRQSCSQTNDAAGISHPQERIGSLFAKRNYKHSESYFMLSCTSQ
eukprot:905252-Pleurochrysis_carterae.AAC.2